MTREELRNSKVEIVETLNGLALETGVGGPTVKFDFADASKLKLIGYTTMLEAVDAGELGMDDFDFVATDLRIVIKKKVED